MIDSERKPGKLWVYEGRELYISQLNKLLEKNGILMYHTFDEDKAIVIERFNRSLKNIVWKSRTENPQKLTQLSSRSHPRHLVGKKTAQKDTIIDITSDSQVNSNFPYQ